MSIYEIENRTSIFDTERFIAEGTIKNGVFKLKKIISGEGTAFVRKKYYWNILGFKIPYWKEEVDWVNATNKEIEESNKQMIGVLVPIEKFKLIRMVKK